MKKIILMLVPLFCLRAAVTQAQVAEDTTQNVEGQPVHAIPQSTAQPPVYQDDVRQNEVNKNMVQIQSDELPGPVKKALENPQYKGWEEATLFRDESKSIYEVVIRHGDQSNTYRFDKEGKPIYDR